MNSIFDYEDEEDDAKKQEQLKQQLQSTSAQVMASSVY